MINKEIDEVIKIIKKREELENNVEKLRKYICDFSCSFGNCARSPRNFSPGIKAYRIKS